MANEDFLLRELDETLALRPFDVPEDDYYRVGVAVFERSQKIEAIAAKYGVGAIECLISLLTAEPHLGYKYQPVLKRLTANPAGTPNDFDSNAIVHFWRTWLAANSKPEYCRIPWRQICVRTARANHAFEIQPTDDERFDLAGDTDPVIRSALARNPRLSEDIWSLLALSPEADIRLELLQQRDDDPLVLRLFAQDRSAVIRAWVASRPQTPTSVCVELAHDSEAKVLDALLRREQCPNSVLHVLSESSDPSIRKAATEKLRAAVRQVDESSRDLSRKAPVRSHPAVPALAPTIGAQPQHSQEPTAISNRVPKVFHYLRAKAVLELERFEQAHQSLLTDLALFHSSDHPPPLVLFVSHRWESTGHPDPDGHQLKTIQTLLNAIVDVASAWILPPVERVRRLPSIRMHGLFHAALILGAIDDSEDEDNVWRDWDAVVRRIESVDLLENVGVWYDYACIPQTQKTSSAAAAISLKQNLSQLPDLVRTCPLLILRRKDDRYNERGWCAAEVAAARRDRNIIVVRMDLLGTRISPRDLLLDGTEAPEGNAFNPEVAFIRSALDDWESTRVERPHLRGLFIGLPGLKQAEESRSVPLFTTGRNPDAFPQQKDLLILFINTIARLSKEDERDGGLHPAFDLADAVRDAMDRVGLICTDRQDLVFVGLSILMSRHHPKLVPTVEGFYRTAVVRWLRGESVRLVRLRENRPSPIAWELWYGFEGESNDVRPKPAWVR